MYAEIWSVTIFKQLFNCLKAYFEDIVDNIYKIAFINIYMNVEISGY
jgi:hypothetical protein